MPVIKTSFIAIPRATKKIGGAGQIQKLGPHKMGGSGHTPQETLRALKCVLGAPEAPFRACTQYIYACKLAKPTP